MKPVRPESAFVFYMHAFTAFCMLICALSVFCSSWAGCAVCVMGEGRIIFVLPFVMKSCTILCGGSNVQQQHHGHTEQVL